jgi:calcineurin-like phosphoesterase family protein
VTNSGTIWLIADTHFGKQPRGRLKATGMTSRELDAVIRENWMRMVGPDDIVWHLGDVGDVSHLEGLPGEKHLVVGNDGGEREARRSTHFVTAVNRQSMIWDGADVELTHKPTDARSAGYVLHGHLHAEEHPDPRYTCVSVDLCDFGPIRSTEALGRIRKRSEQLDVDVNVN